MNDSPTCPVCSEQEWETLGTRTYSKRECESLNDYCARRYRVIFELWCPGSTEFIIRSSLCKKCGFVIYAPRPSQEDLDAKYKFLTGLGQDQHSSHRNPAVESNRSCEIFTTLSAFMEFSGGTTVLDFGGGDGSLMMPFIEQGCSCFVIDYSSSVVPGVTKLGDTIESSSIAEKFDLIICSHVLEHLSEPLRLARQLQGNLKEQGLIYVEVPLEIWGWPPLPVEPVTHVNFFTPDSLELLLERAGFNVLKCRLGSATDPSGQTMRKSIVIKAIAQAGGNGTSKPSPDAVHNTRRLLRPGLQMWIKMLAINLRFALGYLRKRLLHSLVG